LATLGENSLTTQNTSYSTNDSNVSVMGANINETSLFSSDNSNVVVNKTITPKISK
jgi:hypothetical protein